nr:integrase, catalytic region, zinc finger, CCHC-type, peptidase aspartic, catalytic [Tanacetum cinerariifolium]
FIIKFLKQIEVGLTKTVRYIRTNNGTEFVNQTQTGYDESVDIFFQKSILRTPKQNGIVKRQNRTLVKADRTMLIFSKALMFLWAEAVATACYTKNRSLIHTRHNKTPYEPVHDKKPNLTFLRVFVTLCYPTNDSKDLGKLQPTTNIGIFVGYAPSMKLIESDLVIDDDNLLIKTEIQDVDDIDVDKDAKEDFIATLGRTDLPLVFGLRLLKTYDKGPLTAQEFHEKFITTIKFGNDHFGAIMGCEDYVIGDNVIFKVYYMEGLGHKLFSIGQFCDSDLEVAFRKHSCYVRDTYGVELIKGSYGSDSYTISVEDMLKSSPTCLLSKASKYTSWLWHYRLNHLNFGTINDLARKDLVRGLPKLKFKNDHLCSSCQLGKSKKHTHKSKVENTNLEVLNGKKYFLVIVDDYY